MPEAFVVGAAAAFLVTLIGGIFCTPRTYMPVVVALISGGVVLTLISGFVTRYMWSDSAVADQAHYSFGAIYMASALIIIVLIGLVRRQR